MEYAIDDELRTICRELERDERTLEAWADVESSDWFQTAHYCGGFDATEMAFTFTFRRDDADYCFSLILEQAFGVAAGRITSISLQPSPWP